MKKSLILLFSFAAPWLLHPAIHAQDIPPPRPALPTRPPATLKPEQRGKLQEMLTLLGRIREQEKTSRLAREAFNQEKMALNQEIDALKNRLTGMRKEVARLKTEKARRTANKKEQLARAVQAEKKLAKCRQLTLNYLSRLEKLQLFSGKNPSPPSSPAILAPKLVNNLWHSLAAKSGLLRSIDARRRTIEIAGARQAVMELRLGGVTLLWRTLDGTCSGWRTRDGKNQPLPPSLAAFDQQIEKATRILRRRHTPTFTTLPLPLIHGRGGK